MDLDTFNSLVEGYNDRIIDMQALAAQAGYWGGYFQSRRPKKLSSIVESILKNKFNKVSHREITDQDIQKFEERDLNRMASYNRWEIKNG